MVRALEQNGGRSRRGRDQRIRDPRTRETKGCRLGRVARVDVQKRLQPQVLLLRGEGYVRELGGGRALAPQAAGHRPRRRKAPDLFPKRPAAPRLLLARLRLEE